MSATIEGDPIFEPSDSLSSLVFASTGGGKTTRVAMTAIEALLVHGDRTIVINDVKLEIAPQIAEMCEMYGWNFGVIDDAGAMGEDYRNARTVEIDRHRSPTENSNPADREK